MSGQGTGCLVCGQPVEFPEHTLLCNKCDEENLAYANASNVGRTVVWGEHTGTVIAETETEVLVAHVDRGQRFEDWLDTASIQTKETTP